VSAYLAFHENAPESAGKTTKVWDIVSKTRGDVLGQVRWFGRWRQYTLYPTKGTVWNVQCLTDVAAFITARMTERRSRLGWRPREAPMSQHDAALVGNAGAMGL
jgi:hypothetical protein